MPNSTLQQFVDALGRRVLLSGNAGGPVLEATILEISAEGKVKWVDVSMAHTFRWSPFDALTIVEVLPTKGAVQVAQEQATLAQQEVEVHKAAVLQANKDKDALAAAHALELTNLKAAHQSQLDILHSKMPIASKVGLPDPELPTRASHPDRMHTPNAKT